MTAAVEQDIRRQIEAGNLVTAYDQLRDALDGGADTAGIRYLYVLTLARMGLTDRAFAAYEELHLASIDSADSKALGARLLKDRAFRSHGTARDAALSSAADAYLAVHARASDTFPAINAASLYFLAGQREKAVELAESILARSQPDQPGYYDLATRGEAHALLGDYEATQMMLSRARKADDATVAARAGTRRQISMILAHQGVARARQDEILAGLATGTSVFFCGRMFQMDETVEAGLREQVRLFIQTHDVAAAFGSLACGADILIAEEMRAQGVPVSIVLASPAEVFLETSVLNGGKGWEPRFRACLESAIMVHVAADEFHAADPLVFALTARVAMGMAADFSSRNFCELHQLAILGGIDSQGGTAGTNADLEHWKARGRKATVIRADGIVRPQRKEPSDNAVQAEFARREVSLLFADFAGFSVLPDRALPDLVGRALSALSQTVDARAEHVISSNTWGDSCFVVFDNPRSAAEIATELLRLLRSSDVSHVIRGLRISLHHGIAMEMHDPVLGKPNVFGSAVSRAARIEPVTPPDCIYASHQFAAALADQDPEGFRFDYVGLMPLPKKSGVERLYMLVEDKVRDFS